MTQHTQLEWIADGKMVTVAEKDRPDICSCNPRDFGQHCSGRSYVETFANVKLIASAPELLAVCLSLQESASYWSDYDIPIGIVDQLNAAILKAQPPLTNLL
ncbi:MAG: hypothetical protein QX196_06280 [Methylococcaceae bacterium]